MIFGGAQIGNIFGPYISGLILHDGGDWANVFYFFGGLGVIWFVFWVCILILYVYLNEKMISKYEKTYLTICISCFGYISSSSSSVYSLLQFLKTFMFQVFLCYSTPNLHPFISDTEKEFLNNSVIASGLHKKLDPVPFKALLRSPALWVLILAAVSTYVMITDLITPLLCKKMMCWLV